MRIVITLADPHAAHGRSAVRADSSTGSSRSISPSPWRGPGDLPGPLGPDTGDFEGRTITPHLRGFPWFHQGTLVLASRHATRVGRTRDACGAGPRGPAGHRRAAPVDGPRTLRRNGHERRGRPREPPAAVRPD